MSTSMTWEKGRSRQPRGSARGVLAFAVALMLGAFGAAGSAAASVTSPAPRAAVADLQCLGASATIVGTRGDDVIRGTRGRDVIVSGRGDDTVNGRGGDDLICGRSGDDIIRGGGGDDRVRGWRGKDRITGGPGDDRLRGGPNADKLLGGGGDDVIDGGDARDECDGQAGSNTLLQCEVTPNEPPAAVDDTGTTDEDSAKTIAVLANDTDPDGDALSVMSVATAGTKGTATVASGGSGVSYDPHGSFDALAPGASDTDSFTYTVSDGQGGTDVAKVTVTVTGTDNAPVAVPDSQTVAEDASATTIDVLANDTDVDGGPMTITAVTQPAAGTVAITHGGDDLTYVPTADFCNTPPPSDDFSYTLNGGSAATVHVTVTCVNDAPVVDLNGGSAGSDATAGFTEDSGAVQVAPGAVLSDVDNAQLVSATLTLTNHPDGVKESLTVDTSGTSITAGSYNNATGVLALSGADTVAHYQQVIRSLSYANSSDAPDLTDRVVTVKVNDGSLDSNQPHSTVSVTAHDDAPTAADQSVTTNEDIALPVTLAGTDPENDSLTFSHDPASAHGGTITGAGSSVTYTPAADYCGPDSFGFTVDDGNGGTDTGTVSITVTCVNDAPVVDLNGPAGGLDATASFTEDGGAVPVAPAATVGDVDNAQLSSATVTLTNDPDLASESLTADTTGTSITAGYNSGNGVLTLTGSDSVAHYQQVLRSVAYDNSSDTPHVADRVVDVKVTDGLLDSNQPHSTVSVSAHNDAPTATDQSVTTAEDTAKAVTLSGTDPESDALTFTHDAASAQGGTVTGGGSSVTYTPKADYCGPDSFGFTVDDGNGGTDSGTVSVTVTCVNDAPVVDLNGVGTPGVNGSASFTEDSGAVAVAPGAELSDVDNTQLVSATLTLTNHPDGVKESLSVATSGTSITASSYDSSTGVLTLSGSDTVAHYQQVIRSLSYNNSSDAPDLADRVVDVKVSDGLLDSNQPHSTVSVTAHNDAPTATDQSGLSTNEDTALPVTLAGTDPEGDALTFTHDAASAQGGTVTGGGSSVTYTPKADYCGPDSFGFTVDDGNGGTDSGTVSVTVTCVDDAPVVDLNGPGAGNGSSVSFAEQVSHTGGAVPLAPAGTVTDVDDANLESLTVTLTNHPDGSSEVLTVDTTGTSITADSYDSTSGVLLLHGTDTKAHYQQVLRTVSYRNDAAPPDPTTRNVTFVANDGDADSVLRTATVTVVPLDVPPVLDLDNTTLGLNASASFTEDAGAATLAPNAAVSDADNANLATATVTLTTRPDGGSESLTANVTGTSIIADAYVPGTGVLTLHGSDTVAHYQQVIRTLAYDNTSDTPTTTSRSVTVVVNDGAADSNTATVTVSVTAHNDAPTAVDQSGLTTNEDTAKGITLAGTDPEGDSLTFTHDAASAQGGTVTGAGSSVTYTPAANYCGSDSFQFTVDDGNGGTDTGTVSITVTCVNDAPVVDLNGGGAGIDNSASFTEDQPAVTLAPSADVSDADNANLASATVTLTTHPDGVAEGLTAVTAGTSITADAYDTTTGVLLLHGSDTKAHYQQVLRSVTYDNSSDTPNTVARSVTWTVNDGSDDSATATTTLSVTAANDPPTLDLNGGGAGVDETASYTEDQPATTLAPSAVAADPDDTNLQSATVKLTNHPDGSAESLSVDTSSTSITAVAYDPGTGVLSLSGSDTVAHYQQVLRTVKYVNASQNADSADRVVTFVVHDASADSNSPKVTVTITVVNDPPIVDMNGGSAGIDSSAAFVEDSSPNVVGSGPVNLGASATVSDVDNASLASATLTLTNHPDGANESLSVTIPGGNPITTGGYNAATGVLTLTGPATTAQFQTVIQSAKYNNVSNTPDPTDRDVTVKVNDGAADSTVAHATVTVTPTNDAPVAQDETFNSTKTAIGNTTLNVNDTTDHGGTADGRPATPDPTDTSPVTDRPHKEVTGDILANDTDPESANSALTVTPGTFATNDGGTVTIQADGDFNFEPAPSTSCTDASDFFDYTVNDNAGTDPGSDTGRVTVTITGCVWYVNNNDAQGNSGTSEKPFDTLAQAQTASTAGVPSTIFVYDGDDTTTGYNAGITLDTNQQLLSEAATTTVGSDTLHTADPANKASLTNNNADVVTLAGGSTVKGFNIDPQGTGGGVFGTGLGATTVTLDDLNIADNGTKGTQPGLELDTNTGTTTNISNLVVNNGDGSSATTTDEGVKLTNAGTVDFASAGQNSIVTNGAAGFDAASTNLGTGSVLDGIIVLNSGNGGVRLSNTTGSGTAFGDGVGTDLSLTTVSGTPAAFGVQTAGSFSIPSSGQSDANATGGPAVDVVNSSGSTMPFDSASSTNSSTDGVNLDGLGTGTFSATSGTIGGEAGIGFDLNGGSGAITYPGTFNNGSGPLVAEITGRTGGVVSLSGGMFDTNDAGGGISESGNPAGSTVYSGATKQYNTGAATALSVSNPDGSSHTTVWSGGGTDIDTTSGNGVTVTGVGPSADGSIQFNGTGNTIDSPALGAGNRALNIADVNLTITGVTFQHISSSGGTNGIRLSDTGAAGPFAVQGLGTAGSGGVITGATGAGVDLANVGGGASFDRVNVTNGADDGVRANTVTKLTFNNGNVTGNGNAVNENGLDWTDVTGISGFKGNTISGSSDFNALVANASSTLLQLTVTGNTFSGAATDDGLQVDTDAGAVVRTNIDGNTFSNNHGDAIQIANVDGDTDSSQQDVTINNNTITGSASTSVDGGIVVQSADHEQLKASVTNNSINNVSVSALILNPGPNGAAASTYDATASNNTIGTSGVADSGSVDGDGIQVKAASDGDARIAVTNNTIRNYDKNGMMLRASESNQSGHSTQLTATGNQISQPDPNNSETGIMAEVGSSSADVLTACMDIGGAGALANTFSGALSPTAFIGNFWLSLRFTNAVLQAPGYSPTGTVAGRQAYWFGRNSGFGGGPAPYVEDGIKDMAGHAGGCTQPNPPTLPTATP